MTAGCRRSLPCNSPPCATAGSRFAAQNCLRIGESGEVVATSYEGHVTYDKMLVRQYIVNSSAIYDARVLGKHYQRRIRHEDYDMWLRMFEKADAIVLPENLVYYRVARSSLSGNKLKEHSVAPQRSA